MLLHSQVDPLLRTVAFYIWGHDLLQSGDTICPFSVHWSCIAKLVACFGVDVPEDTE